MRRYLLPIDHCRPNELLVNDSSVLVLKEVTFCELKPIEKYRLNRFAKNFFVEMNRPCGILYNLSCFDARKLIEEPTAARVHQHCVTLHFHELQRGDPFLLIKVMC